MATMWRWIKNTTGNVTMVFALLVPALALLLFGSIDYLRIAAMKQTLQDVADSALLAAALTGLESEAELTAEAKRFLDANLDSRFDGLTVSIGISQKSEDVLAATAGVSVPTLFGDIIGRSGVDVGAYAEAKSAVTSRLELALVLDTTGSMQGSKIAALKDAAVDLADTIMDGKLVSVAVVPFAQYVHVGMVHRDHPGIDVPHDEPGERRCEMRDKYKNVGGRRECRNVPSTCTNDGVSRPCTKRKCEWVEPPERVYVGQREHCWTSGRKIWKGCVGSRRDPRNTDIDFPTVDVPGLLNANCKNPVTRLTTNKGSVTSAIRGMNTGHNTYIAPGLIWGWRSLDHNYPFPDGANRDTTDEEIIKAIVLMTDGANTKSKRNNSAWHTGNSSSNANDVTAELCTNIKDDDVEVYTIAFEVNDNTIKRLLERCATDDDKYFDADNAAELAEAFADIARDLTELHLAK